MSDSKQPWLVRHFRLLTLAEIMESFSPEVFHKLGFVMGGISSLNKVKPKDELVSDEARFHISKRLKEAAVLCHQLGLRDARLNFAMKLCKLAENQSLKCSDLSYWIKDLSEGIERNMATITFFYLPSDSEVLFDKDDLFGDNVSKNFPDAQDDIREAGNCLATGRNTAAVFHCIRATEWAVKAVWKTLGKPAPKKENSWGSILSDLDAQMTLKPSDRLPEFQARLSFFGEIMCDIRAIQKAWRDTTMHIEKNYDAPQAKRVFDVCKHFMQTTSEKLNQNGDWI